MTPKELETYLACNPESGRLFWLRRDISLFKGKNRAAICASWNTKHAGKEAMLSVCTQGYLYGAIKKKPLLAHRVVWAFRHGEWPNGLIDHINGRKTDNRIENLRVVSPAENQKNRRLSDNNSSGVCGVRWIAKQSQWRAQIQVGGKHHFLGDFTSKSDAVAARKAAEKEFMFHENHGRTFQ